MCVRDRRRLPSQLAEREQREADEAAREAALPDNQKKMTGPSNYEVMLKLRHFEKSKVAETEDPVRMGERGWKQRYYKTKLGLDIHNPAEAEQLKAMYKVSVVGPLS